MKTKLLPLLLFTFATNAFAALDTPTEDFIDNNDGTVMHKKTGLTWQRCSVGQTWTGSSCSGSASKMNWDSAMASYGNKTDCNQWRLPRIDEIYSITEHTKNKPAINSDIFKNTISDYYWASSYLFGGGSTGSWGVYAVNFDDGNSSTQGFNKMAEIYVRLVKNGLVCSDATNDNFTPIQDFIDHGNGTVTHKKTGLMWQKCSVGQNWNGSNCSGTAERYDLNYAKNIQSNFAGYNNWRLPTVNELISIVDYKKTYPTPLINLQVFSGNDLPYWSSTSDFKNANYAWFVEFSGASDESSSYLGTTFQSAVRFVRDIQSSNSFITTIDLTSTISTPSPNIQQNANNTYTATAINNGTGTANNVVLKFYMPPRWTNYVSLPSDCAFNGTVTVCSLGSLNAGASVSRSITVNFQKRGATSVGAWAGSDETDTNKANNMSRMITTITK
jgi:hypothetical protein